MTSHSLYMPCKFSNFMNIFGIKQVTLGIILLHWLYAWVGMTFINTSVHFGRTFTNTSLDCVFYISYPLLQFLNRIGFCYIFKAEGRLTFCPFVPMECYSCTCYVFEVLWVFPETPFPRTGISPKLLSMGIHRIPFRGGLSPNHLN